MWSLKASYYFFFIYAVGLPKTCYLKFWKCVELPFNCIHPARKCMLGKGDGICKNPQNNGIFMIQCTLCGCKIEELQFSDKTDVHLQEAFVHFLQVIDWVGKLFWIFYNLISHFHGTTIKIRDGFVKEQKSVASKVCLRAVEEVYQSKSISYS